MVNLLKRTRLTGPDGLYGIRRSADYIPTYHH